MYVIFRKKISKGGRETTTTTTTQLAIEKYKEKKKWKKREGIREKGGLGWIGVGLGKAVKG